MDYIHPIGIKVKIFKIKTECSAGLGLRKPGFKILSNLNGFLWFHKETKL